MRGSTTSFVSAEFKEKLYHLPVVQKMFYIFIDFNISPIRFYSSRKFTVEVLSMKTRKPPKRGKTYYLMLADTFRLYISAAVKKRFAQAGHAVKVSRLSIPV